MTIVITFFLWGCCKEEEEEGNGSCGRLLLTGVL